MVQDKAAASGADVATATAPCTEHDRKGSQPMFDNFCDVDPANISDDESERLSVIVVAVNRSVVGLDLDEDEAFDIAWQVWGATGTGTCPTQPVMLSEKAKRLLSGQ